jgi:hypothetical protein
LAAAAIAIASLACSEQQPPPPASPQPSPSIVTAGCGSTPVLSGHQPAWLVDAAAYNPPSLPYVIATPAIAAGYVFGYPLTSGRKSPSNKILWVVGKPRNGSGLELIVHPVGASTPVSEQSEPPDSSPGEIYPSIVDVPFPGCWHVELTWDGNTAAVDLLYA